MLSCSITTIKLQSYCSVGFVIRQYKVSGSVIRNSYLLIKKYEVGGLKSLYSIQLHKQRISLITIRNVNKQQDYCSVGYAIRQH